VGVLSDSAPCSTPAAAQQPPKPPVIVEPEFLVCHQRMLTLVFCGQAVLQLALLWRATVSFA
jgi:hypothetical protein